MFNSVPCYKCESRYPGCHAKCEKYISWSKEHEIIKDKKAKEKLINSIVRSHTKWL